MKIKIKQKDPVNDIQFLFKETPQIVEMEHQEKAPEMQGELMMLRKLLVEMNNNMLEMREEIKLMRIPQQAGMIEAPISLKQPIDQAIEKDIFLCLSRRSVKGDIELFKMFYVPTKIKPVRCLTATKYEYWDGTQWVLDKYGKQSVDIISSNIRNAYLSVNKLQNCATSEEWLDNQKHILNFTKVQHRMAIFRGIIDI